MGDETKPFEYIITCHVPICPHCGAGLNKKFFNDQMLYICNDCKAAFKIISKGQAEHEFVCHEIIKEKAN